LHNKSTIDLEAVKARYAELEQQLSSLLGRHPDGYGRAIDDALEYRAGLLGLTAELNEFRTLKRLLCLQPTAGSLAEIWPDLT
jgi:hypothetical protein